MQKDDQMEMIMSAASSTTTYRGNACGIFQTLTNTLKRWCAAYITWRMEKIAIAQLRGMSDRELEDIGLTRSRYCARRNGRLHSAAVTKKPQARKHAPANLTFPLRLSTQHFCTFA